MSVNLDPGFSDSEPGISQYCLLLPVKDGELLEIIILQTKEGKDRALLRGDSMLEVGAEKTRKE